MEKLNGHALLTVNGRELPSPEQMTISVMDLSSSESGEDLSGYAHKDVIRIKRKINCEWGVLSWKEVSKILQSVKAGANLSVIYPDVLSGYFETRSFYVGDRQCPAVCIQDGELYFTGLAFNFIEHGGDIP